MKKKISKPVLNKADRELLKDEDLRYSVIQRTMDRFETEVIARRVEDQEKIKPQDEDLEEYLSSE